IEDTTNLITLDNTGEQDAAGNTGLGTTDSNNYAIDTKRPTATIVEAGRAQHATAVTIGTSILSAAGSGFDNSDLTVANGTLTAVSSAHGGLPSFPTRRSSDLIEDTTNLITLDNTGEQDAAGNTGLGTTDSNNYAIDTKRPTATIV